MLHPHIACSNCGYDLAAHGAGERCPECGTPVMESLRSMWLMFRPVNSLRWLVLALAGCGTAIFTVLASIVAMGRSERPTVYHVSATLAWLLMLGCGMLVSNESAAGYRPWKKWARAHGWLSCCLILIAVLGTTVMSSGTTPGTRRAMDVFYVANVACLALWVVGLLLSVVVILKRLPSYRLGILAGWLTALAGITTVAAIVLMVLAALPTPGAVADAAAIPVAVCGLFTAIGVPMLLILTAWRVWREIPQAQRAREAELHSPVGNNRPA